MNSDQLYGALVARDPRFDGRFFVGVKTTGIYCRPICRVKTPMRKNCEFYPNAAAAEAAGFRPCKLCRPELAPGGSMMEISSTLARAAAFYISQGFLADHSLEDLALKIGVTDRQVRRIFRGEFGVSPVEFSQTQRLLLAKQLLTDSTMPVTSVALASGFKSLRRFNALLKERYRMNPTDLRKQQRKGLPSKFAEFSFRLAYRTPFDWAGLLQFFAARAIRGVECVVDGAFFRTFQVEKRGKSYQGHIEVRNDAGQNVLLVRVSPALLPVCACILERVRWAFDLHADPTAINKGLGEISEKHPGLRLPGSFDGFETAVRAVLGQQISVAAARTIAGRIAEKFGTAVETPISGLTHAFPSAARLAKAHVDDVAMLGIIRARAGTLIALAQAMARGELHLEPGRGIEETCATIRQIPGIGEWTAEYITMRALSWPDAFPHTDLGVKRALGLSDPRKILAFADKWRPWRAYAVLHLWNGHLVNEI